MLTFKVHRMRIGTDVRLCSFPDGTVVQCHIDSVDYDQQIDSIPARSGTNATAAPSTISTQDSSKLNQLDMTQAYAGTQASVNLDSSRSGVNPNDPSSNTIVLAQPETPLKLGHGGLEVAEES